MAMRYQSIFKEKSASAKKNHNTVVSSKTGIKPRGAGKAAAKGADKEKGEA